MGIEETFDLAIQLEEKMSECYKAMGQLCENKPISKELTRLSSDEKAHMNLLLMGKDYLNGAPDLFSLRSERITEMKIGFNKIIGLIESVHGRKIDLEEALNEAVELERLFEQFHLKTIAEVKDASLKKLFRALSTDDKTHRERLINIVTSFYRQS
jgi:rubrerythrin